MIAFGKAWVDMAWRIADLAPVDSSSSPGHRLTILASPNWSDLQSTETALAVALAPLVQAYERQPDGESETVPFSLARYVMLQRVGLEYCTTHGNTTDYANFIRPREIRSAVLERRLSSETVFTQFRAAHQIPEIIIDAVNDHIELAITYVRKLDLPATLETLTRTDRLLEATVLLADILVDNLHTHEYHAIREISV